MFGFEEIRAEMKDTVQSGQQSPVRANDEAGANAGGIEQWFPLEGDRGVPSGATESLDRVGERMSALVDELGRHVSGYLGPWVEAPVVLGITWLKLLLSASLLFLLLMGERTFRMVLNRSLKREGERESPRAWLQIFLRGMGKPLSLLIWVYGMYGALTPLFEHFVLEDGSNPVHAGARLLADAGGSIALFWFGIRSLRLADRFFMSWASSGNSVVRSLATALSQSNRGPLQLILLLLLSRILLSLFVVPDSFLPLLKDLFALGLVASITWLLMEAARVMENFLLSFYRVDVADNRQARRIHTQLRFLRRFLVILVLLLGLASMLMLFDKVRQLGTSLLASAGVLGIVVGLAAQRSIANLLVGLQIAVTQPITLDDVVIIEGEWGRVEEITTTYVVVRIWDLRRLIVPLTYFTEKPFQNWTRTSAEILGTVFLYVDYTVDVDRIRQKLHSLLQESPHWDGKVWGLAVTDSRERTMELRCLMSAADSSSAWDLRCEIREKLIGHIQKNYPGSLPRIRAEWEPSPPLIRGDAEVSGIPGLSPRSSPQAT